MTRMSPPWCAETICTAPNRSHRGEGAAAGSHHRLDAQDEPKYHFEPVFENITLLLLRCRATATPLCMLMIRQPTHRLSAERNTSSHTRSQCDNHIQFAIVE